jgi:hypothetical protein
MNDLVVTLFLFEGIEFRRLVVTGTFPQSVAQSHNTENRDGSEYDNVPGDSVTHIFQPKVRRNGMRTTNRARTSITGAGRTDKLFIIIGH